MLSYFISQDLRFPKSVFLRVYTRLVPFLSILLLLSGLFYSPVFSFLIGFGILNLLLTMSLSKQVRRQADNLHQGGKLLETYVPAFEKIEQRKWRSEWILGLLSEGNREVETPVSVSIKRLSLLLNRLDARLNMLVGMVLNAFLLWEFRQVYALKEWQKYQSAGILASLEVLGTIEALGSLATLHFNRPDWVFPEIVKEAAAYEARQISHPLLQENRAVPSDYSMENHRIALVTGSNMSGKSTF